MLHIHASHPSVLVIVRHVQLFLLSSVCFSVQLSLLFSVQLSSSQVACKGQQKTKDGMNHHCGARFATLVGDTTLLCVHKKVNQRISAEGNSLSHTYVCTVYVVHNLQRHITVSGVHRLWKVMRPPTQVEEGW